LMHRYPPTHSHMLFVCVLDQVTPKVMRWYHWLSSHRTDNNGACSNIVTYRHVATFVGTGLASRYDERSAADDVFRRAASLGEDSGEDGSCWTNTWLRISLDCVVGQVHRSCWQHFSHEWVYKLVTAL